MLIYNRTAICSSKQDDITTCSKHNILPKNWVQENRGCKDNISTSNRDLDINGFWTFLDDDINDDDEVFQNYH